MSTRRVGVCVVALCAAALLTSVVTLAWTSNGHASRGNRATANVPATSPSRLFSRGRTPVTVGSAPPRTGGTDAEACAQCHTEIAREWRESQHAMAWNDPVFQVAYDVEPMAFCRNCHAPLTARGASRPDEVAANEGVSCSVCHVRAGRVLGTGEGRGDVGAARGAPHPVLAVRDYSRSELCAGCHQFNFPADAGPHRPLLASDEPMQDTYEEWRLSTAAAEGTQCQGCHMPFVEGANGTRWRSHRFPGGRDPAMLARAATVSVSATRDGEAIVVRARVSPSGAGHSFPTGDLFRRVELRVWIEGEPENAAVLGYARDFRNQLERVRGELAFVRRQSSDTRIPPPGLGRTEERVVRLTPRPEAAPAQPSTGGRPRRADRAETRVRWALDYLLMPTPLAASHGVGEPRNRTLVLEGVVTLATHPQSSSSTHAGGPP